MRAVITGATGLIGKKLVSSWRGDVTVLSRSPSAAARTLGEGVRVAGWDGAGELDPAAVDGADVVIHLAGEPVAEGRWTAAKKRKIEESRVLGTRAVVRAIARASRRPSALVCASAVGLYGSRGDELLSEDSPPGEGFLSDVCAAWEHEASQVETLGVRRVSARIGIVLSPEGGALRKMLPAFRLGLASPLGDGRQWMPWIHVDDVVGLLRLAATDPSVRGPMNAVAPIPVTNREFTRALAKALDRPAFLPAPPRAALRLAFGELADVVLASQRVIPQAAFAAGYRFRFADLPSALEDLVGEARHARSGVGALS